MAGRRSPSPRRALNHNTRRRRRAASRQRDRNEVFATIFFEWARKSLVPIHPAIVGKYRAQRWRVRAGAFSFSQATSSILYVAADDKRYHQLAPEKRMDLRLFVEPAATPASALLLWQNYHSTFMVIFEMTGL